MSTIAPTGFEPVIFALRGRRPRPRLDDGAVTLIYIILYFNKMSTILLWISVNSRNP